MEDSRIRSPQSPAPTNPLARGARQASAANAPAPGGKGGFSLLLADIAGIAGSGDMAMPAGEGREALAGAALEAIELTPQALTEAGIFSLTSLVGQTARIDGAADAALRDGRALADGDAAATAKPMGRPAAVANSLAAAPAAGGAWGGEIAATGSGAAGMAEVPQIAAEPSTLSLTQPEAQRGTGSQGLAALLAQKMDAEAPSLAAGLAAPLAAPAAAAPGATASASVPAASVGQADAALASADAAQAPVAADAVLSPPDEALADQLSEQVAFWVQQKTQRAEMTIDRQGQPVQVQVVITGNEAQVTFRSNEQQTRDMLDASVAQLRELLEQQGLSLGGVTVQTAEAGRQEAGGASAGRDRADRPAAQRGESDGRQTAVVSADLRARPDALRAVDLFV